MSFKARAYIFLIISAGLAVIFNAGLHAEPTDPYHFAAYLALALIASSLKVGLPGVTGTMSVLFLFLLIGIIELSLGETLAIGVAAVFVQSFWRTKKRPGIVHVAFNIASLLIAIDAAHLVYKLPELLGLGTPFPVRLAACTFTFFVGNTLTISTVIALTENKSVIHTWRSTYFWTFPYYIVGGCIAGLFSSLTHEVGWQTSILFLPIIYLIYRSYRLYLDRMDQGRLHAEQLQAAANRLNAVLESTTDLVLATDVAGKITYINQRARDRLFGDKDPADAVLWQVFPTLASGGFPERVSEAIKTRTPVTVEEQFFPECNASFEVHAYPSVEGVAYYLKDVTEERELAEQLRQSQKMEAIGRLAGGVAHDFNNLLTIILGYGQLLDDMVEKDSVAHSAVTEILRAGDRAAGLTQRLLAFSRKQVLQPAILDLNSVVTGFEGMLRRLIGEDIRTVVQLDPSIGKVKADRNQIEQVVMNLAVNARDAMPKGGELTIRTYSTELDASQARHHGVAPGRYAVLSVSDTGIGMDAATKARIFEPFFTTKDPGKGTGLGLSMVYGIAQQSGGYVTVYSEPQQGATFEIHLPAVTESAEAVSSSDAAAPMAGKGKILLIEDENSLRDLAYRMLTEAGYTVSGMASGIEAIRIEAAELESFDLLLTDVIMPEMNGQDVAKELLSRHRTLKVLFMSGYTDHPRIGPDDFAHNQVLQKPFTRAQLLSKVHSLLPADTQRV